MEMEMEMRAREEIDIGQDITPSVHPLSFSLHHSLLHSHCSSCFSPLPFSPLPPTFPPNFHHDPTLFYCSPSCSSSDSPLHISSAEYHLLRLLQSPPSLIPLPSLTDTSDLRAALRFLQSHHASRHLGPTHRIAGLLTNREKLMNSEDEDELLAKIRNGAKAMASARAIRDGLEVENATPTAVEEEEAALCLVITNAVDVQDHTGRSLGIAVYDTNFSWINHSCSPNSCYRFTFNSPISPPSSSILRILPCSSGGARDTQIESGSLWSSNELAKVLSPLHLNEERQGYGPKVILRSIKRIKKGEEVTVAYTDLLQPKALRQLELWSRYHFLCCCRRCSTSSLTYVDNALQEIFAANHESLSLGSDAKFYTEMATRRLSDYVDDVISEYLSSGDPESCCVKLENILTQGIELELEGTERKSYLTFRLHPLHHLSLNAYTTLASAYRVCSSDLLTLKTENWSKAFDMSRTSAAYSLLLAGATNHLFHSELSLIASLSNFWTSAGESLLSLARSTGWNKYVKWLGLSISDLSSIVKYKCSKCSLMDIFIAKLHESQFKIRDFEDISREFLECVGNITQEVWSFLVCGCQFLRLFIDPIDFSRLGATNYSGIWNAHCCLVSTPTTYLLEADGHDVMGKVINYSKNGRRHIFQLGVHCLVYGGFLASICYGQQSHLVEYVQSFLDHEGYFMHSNSVHEA